VNWTTAASAVTTAFLSSLVEAVEALTIVLAVTFVRGWRPAGLGAVLGVALLALIVLALGRIIGVPKIGRVARVRCGVSGTLLRAFPIARGTAYSTQSRFPLCHRP
jgi:uncharacterized membrane protein